ncbi:hypothetical protein QTJ16_000723 [Diplocarpon rosae]|uniref:Uncharacterized protein n=1 Tax=Diplocarpon rosae TaxID=946125 RepID=A0AAD9T4K7_9HELO|nr:hypothetical protein QTJ16_000723 [Diplocarpon rosae]
MSSDKVLDAKMFDRALKLLDAQMSRNDFLNAFSPINVVTVGGFVAVKYFGNRMSTGDLDYMIEQEWAEDNEIKLPINNVIKAVAEKEALEYNWMNDELQIWASPTASKTIFAQAFAQNIILFDGKGLKVWAAPLIWGLERKLRRTASPDHKQLDMDDLLAHFKYFGANNGAPLGMEYF